MPSLLWGPIFFWVAWGVVSAWVLRVFYVEGGKRKLIYLKVTVVVINGLVLVLLFFPWLPVVYGGYSGWHLILRGRLDVALYGIMVVVALVLLLQKEIKVVKVGVVMQLAVSLIIFLIMIMLLPNTVQLVLRDTAPIISVMLLLTGNVAAFLVWHQLQLVDRES